MIWKKHEDDDYGAPMELKTLPLLPLRDIVVFPYMVIPLFVGRDKSIAALQEAMAGDKEIFLVAQRSAKTNEPGEDDIYEVGTVSLVMQMLRLPDGTVKVLAEGKRRARVKRYVENEEFFQVEVEPEPETPTEVHGAEALIRSIKSTFETYVKLEKRIPPEMLLTISNIEESAKLADVLAAQLNLKVSDKQHLLESSTVQERLESLLKHIQSEIEILQVQKRIRSRVKKQMEKTQREYYLNEQMQAIQRELGDKDDAKSELQELHLRAEEKDMPEAARLRLKKELGKLKMMSPMSAEAAVLRTYIDWILDLPWEEYREEVLDIEQATDVLDEDHYGLRKVKERILEYLAVQSLVEKMRGPILCLVGPPGVGKTSLAKSIARATGRDFVRLSLGGVRDEAEIRGHRRTYIGALPGKLIQRLKKCESNNPVFLLDEIDKMSADFRGDPASALLEVLDPEQNETFNDHYIDLDYDLSRVFFITTANTLQGIPVPLQDRLEIIRLSGYTEAEKMAISRKYLVPRQMEAHGLSEEHIEIRNTAIQEVIQRYTREAGVRNLERELGSIARKVAKKLVADRQKGEETHEVITPQRVQRLLGVPKYRFGTAEQGDEVGFVNGLAWTQVGGALVPVEAAIMPGSGKLILTGQLGDVMQESGRAALSYIRSRSSVFGLKKDFYKDVDIHVHVPEIGPVDGPSAGITMCTAMTSALLRIPVRRNVAMTGEITLRGNVRPIGGLKEKTLAAHRGEIAKVIVPRDNAKDIPDIPVRIRSEIEIVPVEHMDQVLKEALLLEEPDLLFAGMDPRQSASRQLPSPELPSGS
ncbi:MAG: endopeptidase La [Rickettsiales bacterium]|nr:endopeptidase La [Rickettsiales bacterium]|tara:strand:+ start:409 stop:2853 length:2445 start_codon:yes stop_codon:yes gene_type:complete